jgi:bile acid:Na+ symporter, BASS family
VSQLPAIAVLLLMLSTGMSINRAGFVSNWKKLTPGTWTRLLLATFILPPALVLLLAQVFPMSMPSMAGLYLIAVAPGAPLMTRNVAKHGFDMEMAAGYQLWGALLAPVMIPLLVVGAGWLYGREVWIAPREVLALVAKQQFLPLLAGMAVAALAPDFSARLKRPLNLAGNILLTLVIIMMLIKVGPALVHSEPLVVLSALILALGCLVGARLMIPKFPTLAVSNVNRHVGLALLLSGTHIHNGKESLPAIAVYAIFAPLVMALHTKWVRKHPIADGKQNPD